MKYSDAWPELEKGVRRIRKEAKDQAESARGRADLPAQYKASGKHEAAEDILDLIDQLEWEFE